jgi:hypothetical protein
MLVSFCIVSDKTCDHVMHMLVRQPVRNAVGPTGLHTPHVMVRATAMGYMSSTIIGENASHHAMPQQQVVHKHRKT